MPALSFRRYERAPDTPDAPALFVKIDMLPKLVAVPQPEEITIDPPNAVSPTPPSIVTP